MTQLVPAKTTAQPSLLQTLSAIAGAAVVLLVVLNFVMTGGIGLLFGSPIGLVYVLGAAVIAVVLISFILRASVGRAKVGAAVVVTLVAFVALAVAVAGFGTIPMLWVQPGFELVHVLIAVPVAMILGLFLGSWPARTVGFAGLALLIAGAVLVLPDAQPEAPSQAELNQETIDANFEAYIDAGAFPMVADVPGGRIAGIVPDGGPSRVVSVTEDGGVVEVTTDPNATNANPEILPCWALGPPDMGLEDTDTMEDYSAWCVEDNGVWRLTNGTGYARMESGAVIAARSALHENVTFAGGERPANAEEVLEAWGSLRPMTEDEVRAFWPWQ